MRRFYCFSLILLAAIISFSCCRETAEQTTGNYAPCGFSLTLKCVDNGQTYEIPVKKGVGKNVYISDYESVIAEVTPNGTGYTGVNATSSNPSIAKVTKLSTREILISKASGATFGESTISISNGGGSSINEVTFSASVQPEEVALLSAVGKEGKQNGVYSYKQGSNFFVAYLTAILKKFGKEYREISVPSRYISSVKSTSSGVLNVSFADNASVSIPYKKATFQAPEQVTLRGWKDAQVELPWSLSVDIPGMEPRFSLSGDFFAMAGQHLLVASSDNYGVQKEGLLTISGTDDRVEKAQVKVIQTTRPPQDAVLFTDQAFEAEMLSRADVNRDGYVSFSEALSVETIELAGKGIKDLTGLENFKKVWKLDLRNNDIVDATCLKELPLLHWLDLRGNKGLKVFDVTGCTEYFDHCEFEVTPELTYYRYIHQILPALESDPYQDYCTYVHDTRMTTDWSHHKNTYLVKSHTKTMTKSKFPWLKDNQNGMVPSIVFSGCSYIDVDFNDGSWKRIMDEAYRCFMKYSPIALQWIDYFDVYYMEYLTDNRERYYYEGCGATATPEAEAKYYLRLKEQNIWEQAAYDTIYGDTTDKVLSMNLVPPVPTKQYPAQLYIGVHSHICSNFKPNENGEVQFVPFHVYQNDKWSGNGRAVQYLWEFWLDSPRADHYSPNGIQYGDKHPASIEHFMVEINQYREENINMFLQFAGFTN